MPVTGARFSFNLIGSVCSHWCVLTATLSRLRYWPLAHLGPGRVSFLGLDFFLEPSLCCLSTLDLERTNPMSCKNIDLVSMHTKCSILLAEKHTNVIHDDISWLHSSMLIFIPNGNVIMVFSGFKIKHSSVGEVGEENVSWHTSQTITFIITPQEELLSLTGNVLLHL